RWASFRCCRPCARQPQAISSSPTAPPAATRSRTAPSAKRFTSPVCSRWPWPVEGTRAFALRRVAELGGARLLHQLAEALARDVHERRVVAAFEIHVGGVDEVLLDHNRHAIGGTDGRDGTPIAIVKQLCDLVLGGKAEALAEYALKRIEFDAVAAR